MKIGQMSIFKKITKEAKSYEIQGQQLSCDTCDHTEFYWRRIQLNTSLLSFFNLDWANRSASCFTCANCRRIHWYDA